MHIVASGTCQYNFNWGSRHDTASSVAEIATQANPPHSSMRFNTKRSRSGPNRLHQAHGDSILEQCQAHLPKRLWKSKIRCSSFFKILPLCNCWYLDSLFTLISVIWSKREAVLLIALLHKKWFECITFRTFSWRKNPLLKVKYEEYWVKTTVTAAP